MPLCVGDKLGPYEILALIGKGGMGEVWKAHDPRLRRDVAIKVSVQQFSERFEREAHAIAALNHTNICQVYDVGPNYLVMEFIEGESPKGPLPLDEVLRIARQIADALEAAHEKGITHRDLKPGNIKIKLDGTVKVLDFGLAKVGRATGASGENSPTLTIGMTEAGMILGTAAYMAPEQARGKENVDKRADIWAFGVVLYELLTGKKLFQGEDVGHTLAAVIMQEPDLSAAPIEVQRLLKRCLEKDPQKRLRDIGDVWELLDERTNQSPRESSAPQSSRWLWRSVAAIFFVIAAVLAFLHFREPGSNRHAYRLQLEPPENGEFVAGTTATGGFTISPDGTTAVYVANVKGKTALWIHPLNGTPRMLDGTEDAGFPFWSPDGKSIAFFAGGKLLRTTIAEGTPVVLCDVGSPRGGTWSEDGHIFVGTFGAGMFQVPESGGMPTVLTKPKASSDGLWPQVLPGGRLLYWNIGGDLERGAYAASLAKPDERVQAIASDANALFAPGGDGKDYLLLLRGAALLAQEVNRDSLQLSGAPRLVSNPVGSSGNTAYMRVAASANGVLIYQPSTLTRFAWFDRAGKALGVVGEPADYSTFRLSPDGQKVAASRLTPGGSDLWLLELDRGISTPFARGRGPHAYPIWSRDGSAIVFEGPTSGLFRRLVQGTGTGQEMGLVPPAGLQTPYDWSRDGRLVLYSTGQNVWILPVTPGGNPEPEAKPKVYLERRFNLTGVRFSPVPNPKWVAYYSNESGRYEVYVQTFPEPHGAVRVSTGGGRWPEWGPDGRELFYVSADNKLMSASFGPGGALDSSAPRELFALPNGDNQFSPYDVTSDGQRFLVRTPAEQANRSLTVIINWPDLLKRGAEPP